MTENDGIICVNERMGIYISLKDQHNILKAAMDIGITHMVVVPWTRCTPTAAFPTIFDYHFLPGYFKNYTEKNHVNFYVHETVNYIVRHRRQVTNNEKAILICDDYGGRSGAAYIALAYLMLGQNYNFHQACKTMRYVLRGRVRVDNTMMWRLRNHFPLVPSMVYTFHRNHNDYYEQETNEDELKMDTLSFHPSTLGPENENSGDVDNENDTFYDTGSLEDYSYTSKMDNMAIK